jgi:hypothetical protein
MAIFELRYALQYDILIVQKVAMNKRTKKAYCSALSKYTMVYSSGRAAIYVHKRWNIKTLKAAKSDN